MARIRTIKPEFFLDEKLAENLTPIERLLWVGLWCLADREGRLEDRPKFIKSQVFPYENVNVDTALQKLHDCGYILRYAQQKRFIQIKNFLKYQRPYHKEPESTIPEPHPIAVIAASSNGHDRKENAGSMDYGSMDYGHTDIPKTEIHNGAKAQRAISDEDVYEVFKTYLISWNKDPKYLLTPDRKKYIRKAISQHGKKTCIEAVHKFRADPWEDRGKHNGIEYLFGDQKKIDKWCLMQKPESTKDRVKRELQQEGKL